MPQKLTENRLDFTTQKTKMRQPQTWISWPCLHIFLYNFNRIVTAAGKIWISGHFRDILLSSVVVIKFSDYFSLYYHKNYLLSLLVGYFIWRVKIFCLGPLRIIAHASWKLVCNAHTILQSDFSSDFSVFLLTIESSTAFCAALSHSLWVRLLGYDGK